MFSLFRGVAQSGRAPALGAFGTKCGFRPSGDGSGSYAEKVRNLALRRRTVSVSRLAQKLTRFRRAGLSEAGRIREGGENSLLFFCRALATLFSAR